MKKYFKFIVACVLSLSIVLTSSYVFTLNTSARSADYVAEVLDVVDYNVKRAVDTVQNGTRVGWDIINKGIDTIGHIFAPSRTTYTPSSDYSDYPVSSSTYNDYNINYYTVDNTSSSYLENTYNAYNNYTSEFYDYTTNQYYETTNNYVTTNVYNTYDYTFNDNRVFVTETYNSIIYTYVNPETRTVDCYMCAFAMPTGDSSFNYSSGYCKGLYWVYGVTNYDYEMDDNSLLAYWRLDGDLSNEVPDSPFKLNYYANEFGEGKYGYALRCNGPYDMMITSPTLNTMLPSEFTLCGWYYNGDPNYKSISPGWHYYCWIMHPHRANLKKELYIDGVYTVSTETRSQVFIGNNGPTVTQITDGAYAFRDYATSRSGKLISAYHPLINEECSSGTLQFNNKLFGVAPSSYFNIAQLVLGGTRGNEVSDIGIGPNSPFPLHYAPVVDDYRINFLYTGTNDTSLSGSAMFWAYGSDNIQFSHPYEGSLGVQTNCLNLPDGTIFFSGTPHFELERYLSNPNYFYSVNGITVPTKYPSYGPIFDTYFDRYDLSNCYWDELRIFNGARYDMCMKIQVSRQELEVGYIAPSTFNHPNGIGVQSTVPVNQFRIGGVIPTLTHEGDVWFKIENGYCTSCVQFYSGAWHEVNFGVFDGDTWRNGYTYNFYNLSFDATDYDTGTVPTSVINYYYGDTYNVYNDYFKDNQSEKENAISWWTSLIGLISGAFTAIVPFLTGYLGFLPVWLIVPFLTFIPILLILLIVKIKDIFK